MNKTVVLIVILLLVIPIYSADSWTETGAPPCLGNCSCADSSTCISDSNCRSVTTSCDSRNNASLTANTCSFNTIGCTGSCSSVCGVLSTSVSGSNERIIFLEPQSLQFLGYTNGKCCNGEGTCTATYSLGGCSYTCNSNWHNGVPELGCNVSEPVLQAVGVSPNPVVAGSAITFSAKANSGGDTETISMYVCKTTEASSSGCTGGTWCSTAGVTSNPNCTYTTSSSDAGTKNYYVYIYDYSKYGASANGMSGSFTVSPAQTCNSNCTSGSSNVCNSTCCSITAGCAGQNHGTAVCTDSYHYATCCTGTPTSCPTNSTCPHTNAWCKGATQNCSADTLLSNCTMLCSGGVCASSCTPTCQQTCTTCPTGQTCSGGICTSNPICNSDCTFGNLGICNASCSNSCSGWQQVCSGLNKGTVECSGNSQFSCCNWTLTACGTSSFCSSGSCTACSSGTANCYNHATCDVNTKTDNNNCGSCGHACGTGQNCSAGSCVASGSVCGNGICEAGENYCNCRQDCGVQTCSGDVPGEFCKIYTCSGASCIEVYKDNCCGNNKCEAGEGCATCPHDCPPCAVGETCINNQCSKKQLLKNGENCADNSDCNSNYCDNGLCCAAGDCCRIDSNCNLGQICSNFTCQTLGAKCSDGTLVGQCSGIKPKYCNNGNFVYACATCGCTDGDICTINGICSELTCSDGTPSNSCSDNRPYFCMGGALVSNCSSCGCSEGFVCDKSSDVCHEIPTITIILPSENATVNTAENKKVVVSGLVLTTGKVSYRIEGNDSSFILTSYNPSTGEFNFENISPIPKGLNSMEVHLKDIQNNTVASDKIDFNLVDTPQESTSLFSLQNVYWLVLIVLLLLLFAVLLKALMPAVMNIGRGVAEFPQGSILLVEGRVGSGKEDFCLGIIRKVIRGSNFAAVLSHDPVKEESWFGHSEKERIVFLKVEPDINEISWSISKALSAKPKGLFFNIMDLLMLKYNSEELTDFLNSNFKKMRDAECGAVFCVDKGVDEKNLSAIEGLFDGVVEFQVKEEKGTLSSYYRVREFKLSKIDTNWRKFK